MIIVGAKGFAKEILQILSVDMNLPDEKILFFDNVSENLPEKLFGRFIILKTFEAVKDYFSKTNDKTFVLGLGIPRNREKMYNIFVDLGGEPKTVIAKKTETGNFDVVIGDGTSIMSGCILTNSITLGKGCLINLNTTIGHDCIIGDFVEVSPNTNISGRCTIGDFSSIGTNAIIIPDVTIGKNVVVGAGTLVLKNVPDDATIVGVPGRIIK